jgi:transposase InsO family protein
VLALFNLLRWILLDLFRARSSLEAEVIALRQQLNVLRRGTPKRPALKAFDRLILMLLYRLTPMVLDAVTIVRPETIVRWHRAGFRTFWRWKSRRRPGRPKVPLEVRQLIREMSLANPLWGAPRIHGELLKLGIDVGQTSVAKYMARHRRPPSQGWRTFLLNHVDGIASIDLFVVPTISFRLLYGLLILRHDRRRILWLAVTRTRPPNGSPGKSPRHAVGTARLNTSSVIETASMARHLRAAFGLGIRDRPTTPRSPWQNGHAERLIGSIRRECVDHVIVFGEQHLRRLLRSYQQYYNRTRTHLSLGKDSPVPRAVHATGSILPLPILGGLHHHYVRI